MATNVSSSNGGGPPPVQINVDDLSDLLANRLVSPTSQMLRQFTGSRNEKQYADRWMDDFVDMATAMNWNEQALCRKFSTYLAGNAKDWYKTDVVDTAATRGNWGNLRTAFLTEFLPSRIADHRRLQLETRRQNLFEDVSDYIRAKKRLCKDVNPGMEEAEKIKNIFNGLQPDILEKVELFKDVITNVGELKMHAIQAENAIKAKMVQHGKQMDGKLETPGDTEQAMYVAPRNKYEDVAERVFRRMMAEYEQMQQRGGRNHTGTQYQHNDSRNRTEDNDDERYCYYCFKDGHTVRQCRNRVYDQKKGINVQDRNDPEYERQKHSHTANLVYDEDGNSDESIFMAAATPNGSEKNNIMLKVGLNGNQFMAFIDTGATRTVIDESVFEQLAMDLRTYRGSPLQLADGREMVPMGECQLPVTATLDGDRVRVEITALVCENLPFDVLLGNDFNCQAGMVIDCKAMKVSFKKVQTTMANNRRIVIENTANGTDPSLFFTLVALIGLLLMVMLWTFSGGHDNLVYWGGVSLLEPCTVQRGGAPYNVNGHSLVLLGTIIGMALGLGIWLVRNMGYRRDLLPEGLRTRSNEPLVFI